MEVNPSKITTTARKKLRKGAVGVKKVRTGCLTCKIRHKKCDEKIPCTQCVSTDRKCDFLPTSSVSTRPTPSAPKHNMISKVFPPLQSMPQLNNGDKEYFDCFRQYSIPEFALYFQSDFCSEILLQAVHTEPFALHACLALVAFGREMYSSGVRRRGLQTNYPVTHYNLALRLLNDRLDDSDQGLQLMLLGTILFVGIEMVWSDISTGAKVESLLDSACQALSDHPKAKRFFPASSRMVGAKVTWADFRRGNDVNESAALGNLMSALAQIALQVMWFKSYIEAGCLKKSIRQDGTYEKMAPKHQSFFGTS